MSDGFELPNLG